MALRRKRKRGATRPGPWPDVLESVLEIAKQLAAERTPLAKEFAEMVLVYVSDDPSAVARSQAAADLVIRAPSPAELAAAKVVHRTAAFAYSGSVGVEEQLELVGRATILAARFSAFIASSNAKN
jgi:hypothetical protein